MVDNKYPTFIKDKILYFISNIAGEKQMTCFDLSQLNKSFEVKTFSLLDNESEIPLLQYILFVLFITIVFWGILKIFSFKDYIKGLILYDEKYIYFNNETVSINKQEKQLISFLSSKRFISANELNLIISNQEFTKSHFTSLRNKLVAALNEKLFLLTKNKNCIIETKHPIDNRIKVYKANSSIINKKISFYKFIFKK